MTRRIVYGISLWIFLAATSLTLTSMALPTWISYTSPNTTPTSQPIHITYGLHKRCSSLTNTCVPFPQSQDCHGTDRYFCSMWRSVGFLMNFSVVLELATLFAFGVVLIGGRTQREGGWKMLVGLMATVVVCQVAAMGIVAFLFDNDNRFFVGWKLDKSFILCTVSWVVLLLDCLGVAVTAKVSPPEDDYEVIPDRL